MRRHLVVAAVSAALLGTASGCGGDAGPGGGATPGVPTATSTLPPAKGGPLTDLPVCSAPPEAVDEATDVVLPEDTVVTGIEDLGELVSVQGYVAMTPIEVRRFYSGASQLQVYVAEDEVYEAEILFGQDESRIFVRAQAQCQQGSVLSVFIGPEDGEGLPPLSGN